MKTKGTTCPQSKQRGRGDGWAGWFGWWFGGGDTRAAEGNGTKPETPVSGDSSGNGGDGGGSDGGGGDGGGGD